MPAGILFVDSQPDMSLAEHIHVAGSELDATGLVGPGVVHDQRLECAPIDALFADRAVEVNLETFVVANEAISELVTMQVRAVGPVEIRYMRQMMAGNPF